MNLYMLGGAAVAVLTLAGGAYWAGADAAREDCRAEKAKLNAAAQAEALDQARRVDRLHVEIEVLRARPERVRTIVKEIRVEADADCRSLPPDWRLLWNALPRAAEPAGAAAVGDGGLPGVAGAARTGEGER
jgi:hypothetical protein